MNKIEQIERDIAHFKGVLYDYNQHKPKGVIHRNRLERVIKNAELALEIEKGEAHVMRWVNVDKTRYDVFGDVLKFGVHEYGHSIGENIYLEEDSHYATFNNSPEIPTPKD